MRLFFSVGEPSGDEHAAHLVEELRRRRPDVEIEGFGGPRMEAAGCRLHYPLTNLAVMGVFKVLPLLHQFYRLVGEAEKHFRENPPDAVVLVDFPGFNWHVARVAKKHGIPVVYYLPPQMWAWASWRIKKVRKYVDHLLCGLPFEKAWYAERGVHAEYVGHPFFDEVADKELDAAFLGRQRERGGRVVGILPGSRNGEVTRNFRMQLEVAESLSQRFPDVRFLVANFKSEHSHFCREAATRLGRTLPIEFHTGRTSEIVELAECCLMVSGSVSLELLARETPATVVYSAGWLKLLSGLLAVDYFTLPNLMADRPIMPEFATFGHSAEAIAGMGDVVGEWLSNPASLDAVRKEMAALRRDVGRTGATAHTAEAILDRMSAPQAKAA